MKHFEILAKALGTEALPETFEKLDFFVRSLFDWNQRVNLVSKESAENIWSNHIVPSLTYALFMDFNSKYLDIGTGAGLPGLVLKIMYPGLKIDLVDSNRKKTLFCKYIINELKILDIVLFNDRVENLTPVYDGVLFRAVSAIAKLQEMAKHVLTKKGHLITIKGQNEEMHDDGKNIDILQIPAEIATLSRRLTGAVFVKSRLS